ncbi:MAG: hypothetical protein E7Z79_08745 [Methanobrevibacter thaueri]|uniref:Uncharacterized protein n=1 Tax=Methanobrevibacter thaueri TaxID=190975 RepID=A0A8T3VF29_9EURY|nr:hypothetical protein [Methanobrevibacter thaueri]MBE6502507.1 hypothetical protein [Methanobrevibacter thaueri]
MNYIILAILFLLSGFFMKYSDDFFDEKHDLKFASIFGVLCGLASAIATVSDVGAAYVFIAILIGNLIALKVDGIHHIISMAIFVVVCLICGIPDLNLIVLLVCIVGALSDEIGHETIGKVTDNTFLNLFFEYRFVMKIVIFVLAFAGAFDVFVFICFILFELAYEFAGITFEKLN